MGSLADAAAMRHMDVHMEAEERYAEACLAAAGADRLARKLQLEMASRLASEACTAPARWGPWLYYRRADEGKQYPVLCRRSAALHGEFVSYSDPSAGFDFTAGKRIEQKLVDYNKEADRRKAKSAAVSSPPPPPPAAAASSPDPHRSEPIPLPFAPPKQLKLSIPKP
jgi:protease II